MSSFFDNIEFAGIAFSFVDFKVPCLFEQWKWKLDSYVKEKGALRRNAAVIVRSLDVFETITMDSFSLLQDESSGFFQRQVYQDESGEKVWQCIRRQGRQIYLQYIVSQDWSEITLAVDATQTAGQVAFEYLGQIMPGVLLKHYVLSFHGVLMEFNGQGIIISAASGTGKTTHARLWRDCKNALIINGDRATCKKVDGVWTGYGLPWSGTSGEQINRSVPMKALVVLERAEENSAEVIYGLEAFGALFPHVLYPSWDVELTGKAMELVDDFMKDIPVIRLKCRPDVESVEVLNRVLEEI